MTTPDASASVTIRIGHNRKARAGGVAADQLRSIIERIEKLSEEKDAIGKRYRRQDAIGTPFCITVDHQTKEDHTVTIRHRDSMTQERIPIASIKDMVLKAIQAF